MKRLADGVWQLSGFPPNAINVFVIENVLIDASTRYATRRILRSVEGHRIAAHALTHAHPDHQGASHQVCERLGIPFWVGEPDAPAAERPELIGERQPDHFMAQFFFRTCTGPGHPVDRQPGRGRRGRRLRGPARARPLRRPRRLLARVRPRADRRRRVQHGRPAARHPRAARAEALLHPRPGAQPALRQAARRARAEAAARRPRAAVPRHAQVRRLLREPAG